MNDGNFNRFERMGRQMAGERNTEEELVMRPSSLESSPDAAEEWSIDARMAAAAEEDGADDDPLEDEDEDLDDEDEDEDDEDEDEDTEEV